MSYFDILAPIVRPILINFTDDLEKHDLRGLDGYTGEFVYGCRPSGTDLFKVEISAKAFDAIRELFSRKQINTKAKAMPFLRNTYDYQKIAHQARNKYFFHGKNGKVKPISQEKAVELIELYYLRMVSVIFEEQLVS